MVQEIDLLVLSRIAGFYRTSRAKLRDIPTINNRSICVPIVILFTHENVLNKYRLCKKMKETYLTQVFSADVFFKPANRERENGYYK
jgi:hypothetical protein